MVVFSHISQVFYPYLHNFNQVQIPDVFYIQKYIYNSPFAFFYSGATAVYVFFILSGIVLTRSMRKKDNDSYINTVISRYPRLMLPALFSCILVYFIYKLFIVVEPNFHFSSWYNKLYISNPSIIDAIYNAAISPFFYGTSIYNSVLWTMKVELIGSLYIYSFCYLSMKIGNIKTSITFLLSIIPLFFINPILSLGIFSFYIGFLISKFDLKIKSQKISLLSLMVGAYLAGAHNTSDMYLYIQFFLGKHTYILCSYMASFFIIFSVISNVNIQRILSFNKLKILGEYSFSIYLIHIPIIIIVVYFVFTNFNGYNFNYLSFLSTLLILSLSILSSSFFYRLDTYAIFISKKISKFIFYFYKKYILVM